VGDETLAFAHGKPKPFVAKHVLPKSKKNNI
jgi:hypothetical protein